MIHEDDFFNSMQPDGDINLTGNDVAILHPAGQRDAIILICAEMFPRPFLDRPLDAEVDAGNKERRTNMHRDSLFVIRESFTMNGLRVTIDGFTMNGLYHSGTAYVVQWFWT